MSLALTYTDTRDTNNDTIAEVVKEGGHLGVKLTSFNGSSFTPIPGDSSLRPSYIFKFALEVMEREKAPTVSFILPPEWYSPTLADAIGQALREICWIHHPMHALTLVCETPELLDMINHYFQGTWYL